MELDGVSGVRVVGGEDQIAELCVCVCVCVRARAPKVCLFVCPGVEFAKDHDYYGGVFE